MFFLLFLLHFCLAIPAPDLDESILVLAVPEGGEIVCGHSVEVQLALHPGVGTPAGPLQCSLRLMRPRFLLSDEEILSIPETVTIRRAADAIFDGVLVLDNFCPEVSSSWWNREAGSPTDDEYPLVYIEASCGEYGGRSPLLDVDVPLAFVLPSPGSVLVRGHPQTFRFGVATDLVPSLPRFLKSSAAFEEFRTPIDVLDEDGAMLSTMLLKEFLDDEPSRVDLRLNGPSALATVVTFGQVVIDLDAGVYNLQRTLDHKSGYRTYDATSEEVLVVDVGETGLECDLVTLAGFLAWRSYGADNSYVYGKSSFEALPGCNGPILVPVVLYANKDSHVSVHATPDIADYLRGGDVDPDLLSDGLVTISIRGTVLTSVGDWLGNLNAFTESCEDHELPCGDGDVHEGFLLEYLVIRPILLRTYTRLSTIERQPSVLFAGHSQGGALATFATLEAAHVLGINHRVQLVTFGSPKVGFEAFEQSFDQLVGVSRYVRVDSTGDPIPALPIPPYRHVGTLHVVDGDGHSLRGYIEVVSPQGAPRPPKATLDPLPERKHESVTSDGLRLADAEANPPSSLPVSAIAAIVAATLVCCCLLAMAVVGVLLLGRKRRARASHCARTSHLAVQPPPQSSSQARRSRRASRSFRTSQTRSLPTG